METYNYPSRICKRHCVNTMMRNEWNVFFFAYHFQSFIHLFSFLIKSVSSWDYNQNLDLGDIDFDAFGETHDVFVMVSGSSHVSNNEDS